MASSEHLPQECVTTHRWAVLVVEDEILVRLTIAHYLRAASYVVVEAANATEASSRFSRPASRWTSSLLMSGCPAQWTESCSHTGVHEHHSRIHVLVASGNGDARRLLWAHT